jgi:hypothetical protein
MTPTIADVIEALAERSMLPRAYVEHRAREIKDAGFLRIGRLARATPRDVALIVIALAADKINRSPKFVDAYGGFAIAGTDDNVIDAIEAIIYRIWSGKREDRDLLIKVYLDQPLITVGAERFEPHGHLPGARSISSIERVLEIPCRIFAEIGCDLGFKGCRDAD